METCWYAKLKRQIGASLFPRENLLQYLSTEKALDSVKTTGAYDQNFSSIDLFYLLFNNIMLDILTDSSCTLLGWKKYSYSCCHVECEGGS